MRYLITGAAGFIGAHLSRQISASGHEVVGIDSLSNYYSRELKALRINEFLSPFNIENFEINITDLTQLERIFNNFMPETVIHLGAQAGVRLPLNESNIYMDKHVNFPFKCFLIILMQNYTQIPACRQLLNDDFLAKTFHINEKLI